MGLITMISSKWNRLAIPNEGGKRKGLETERGLETGCCNYNKATRTTKWDVAVDGRCNYNKSKNGNGKKTQKQWTDGVDQNRTRKRIIYIYITDGYPSVTYWA